MRGRTCVVTGATSGIGYELARILAGRGLVVMGVGRNPARCAEAAARIRGETGNERVSFEVADLSSQAEVRALAGRIRDRNDRIDVLVNNAGGFAFRRRETVDGIEIQFALNYLAGYLLTRLLLPAMTAAGSSGGARVIMVSSGSHYSGRMHWRDVGLGRLYNGLAAYDQSKLAAVLFTRELARRLGPDSPVGIYAVDPGLVKTNIGMKGTGSLVRTVWRLRTRGGISPEEAAATVAYLALDPLVRSRTGLYWKECRPLAPSRRALDPEDAQRLWDLSEVLCVLPATREPLTGDSTPATISA
jgi:NAD(P)-dependent dehydrogenase (short-subunit alcohol dehydrogenase family)